MTPLEASYRHCRRLARRAASSFCYSFWLLPAEKRRAMYALYAFYRRTDDLIDNDAPAEQRARDLAAWRAALAAALAGEACGRLLPALADTVARHGVPHEYLFDSLAGAEMDLQPPRYETFDDLREYCYRVASVVGLACIHVWGFDGERAIAPAIDCGMAFQLTNILRDLQDDARRGRIYLPRDDLRRFGYGEQELRRGERGGGFAPLMQFQIERTEGFYRRAAALEDRLSPYGRRIYRLMFATYRELLEEIKRRRGDVFSRRVRLSTWRKARLLAREGAGRLRIESCGLEKEVGQSEFSAR